MTRGSSPSRPRPSPTARTPSTSRPWSPGKSRSSGAGKLDAPDDPKRRWPRTASSRYPLPSPHALAVETLPDHHSDPFDRLLIAQARHEGFKLISRDRMSHCTVCRTLSPERLKHEYRTGDAIL